MSYWDTSALVKLYVKEADSAFFEAEAINTATRLVTSRIALYEARSTFQRKETAGALQPGSTQILYSQLLEDIARGEMHLVELGADVEREYGQVLSACYDKVSSIALRTLDALHLASARVVGETQLVATDKRMREAAITLGFSLYPA